MGYIRCELLSVCLNSLCERASCLLHPEGVTEGYADWNMECDRREQGQFGKPAKHGGSKGVKSVGTQSDVKEMRSSVITSLLKTTFNEHFSRERGWTQRS